MADAGRWQGAADALWDAQRDGKPIEPLSDDWPDFGVDDAYQVQLVNIERRLAAGGVVRGHKVGLSSRAMQQMLGVHEPDYGHLLDDMFFYEHDPIDTGRFIQPRAEIEVAVVLRTGLAGPGVTVADVLRAVDFLLPSIEIVDSRVVDWRIRIQDTIADNASSAGVVLGGRPTSLSGLDPALIGALLRKNGEIVETGCSGAVLGNPITAVAWLANKVAAFGVTLEAGQIVMPGACTRMVEVAPGDVIRAEFDVLGDVTARFC
ncbi:2-keto-4-pentenoate hydratase [Acidiferrimicrobium sp. IK]|uniref:2-keto-4-pentenoate hydratase n=1 Tax=Acidiferrimicrobium sp. IK TaxID=2871700 RepID=UPI0021CB16B2|nr:2-keto-4-pentenoate hydratase [Acidiferrimicrobium sp. IK]MCU4183963.1 2-keto-4-pentenoate hydratase [Acidiferrimicrobium sp. IK]